MVYKEITIYILIYHCFLKVKGLPHGSVGTESACNPGDIGDVGSIPELGRSPRGKISTPVFLPGKSHGQRSLIDYSPWDCKQSDKTERLNKKKKKELNLAICNNMDGLEDIMLSEIS